MTKRWPAAMALLIAATPLAACEKKPADKRTYTYELHAQYEDGKKKKLTGGYRFSGGKSTDFKAPGGKYDATTTTTGPRTLHFTVHAESGGGRVQCKITVKRGGTTVKTVEKTWRSYAGCMYEG